MSVYQNINGTLTRIDASDLVQLAAVDTEGILGGTPGATTNGQTLVDQLAADDVQAQSDIGQIKTDLSDKLNIADYAKTGSINVLNNTAVTATSNNVVFTVNADKTIAVYTNGAASADANCEIITSNAPVDYDLYLTGCPSGGSSTTYGIQFYSTNVPNGGWDVGNGRKISATDTITRIVIRIRSGQNIPSSSPLVFKIMLSPIKDAPYAPPAMTNRELTYAENGTISYANGISQTIEAQVPIFKVGSICILNVDMTGVVVSQNTWINIGTIPVGFRPTQLTRFRCMKNASTHIIDAYSYNGPDIQIRDNSGSIAAGDTLHLLGVYYSP